MDLNPSLHQLELGRSQRTFYHDRMLAVVFWQKFDPEQFDFELDEDELARHGVTVDEVVEVIWNGFEVRRNKHYHVGYQVVGYTDGGRRLKLIVYEKQKRVIRVITGWDV